jgi:hypothetical protein
VVEIGVIKWLKRKSQIKFIHITQNEHYQGWNGSRMTGILEMVMNLLFIQRYKDQGVFRAGRFQKFLATVLKMCNSITLNSMTLFNMCYEFAKRKMHPQ